MGAATLVSVEEYLRTSFPDADREYVDGRASWRGTWERSITAMCSRRWLIACETRNRFGLGSQSGFKQTGRAYIHTPKGSHEAKDGILRAQGAGLEAPLSEIFE